jgi:hypothetical protein
LAGEGGGEEEGALSFLQKSGDSIVGYNNKD